MPGSDRLSTLTVVRARTIGRSRTSRADRNGRPGGCVQRFMTARTVHEGGRSSTWRGWCGRTCLGCLTMTAAVIATVTGCAGGTTGAAGRVVHSSASACVPPGGGRCAGPEPVSQALDGLFSLDSSGQRLSGRFACGGELTAEESPTRVALTYIASAVGAGGMACAIASVSVDLMAPLGTRSLVDATDGSTLTVGPAPPAGSTSS